MELGVSGLASGFDWRAFIDQVVELERAPQKRLRVEQNALQQRKNAYAAIKTQLAVLEKRLETLKTPSLFESRSAQVGDSSVLTADVSAGAPLGTYTFSFSQLATTAKWNGSADVGAPISSTADVSGVVLSSAGFTTAVTGGTITVNGAEVTVDTSNTLQEVFDAISTATGGAVTGSYDPATDRISLSSASEIVLGSARDTSNFLQVTKLYNNGTGTISSNSALGGIRRTVALTSANFATAVSDGGAGAGVFKINGVEISFDASADTLDNVLDRINKSEAGVTAAYDTVNDRVILTNKNTGDVGISVVDVTGNFAAATGLASGSLERGKNLLYSINGGATLTSQSNTLTEESSGLAGISITALSASSTTVTVSTDTSKVKTAIENFIEEYNKAQSIIERETASSTSGDGKVKAGTLANDNEASEFAARLRSKAYATISGFAASMNQLADIGIVTNGNDDSLSLDDPEALDKALSTNLGAVQKLFTDETDGLAVHLEAYVESIAGEDGTIESKDESLAEEISAIDTQITDLERLVQSNKENLIQRFVAMETAQAKINQQLQFLQQRFGQTTK